MFSRGGKKGVRLKVSCKSVVELILLVWFIILLIYKDKE